MKNTDNKKVEVEISVRIFIQNDKENTKLREEYDDKQIINERFDCYK